MLAFAAGIAGAVQVAVMGRFGEQVGAIEALAFSLLLSTLIASVALVARSRFGGRVRGGVPRAEVALARARSWALFIVLTITVAAAAGRRRCDDRRS